MREVARTGRYTCVTRCTLTNTKQRDQEVIAEPGRLCDYQAMFLIEVLSQYRARRGAQVLSSRFDKVYHKVGNPSLGL